MANVHQRRQTTSGGPWRVIRKLVGGVWRVIRAAADAACCCAGCLLPVECRNFYGCRFCMLGTDGLTGHPTPAYMAVTTSGFDETSLYPVTIFGPFGLSRAAKVRFSGVNGVAVLTGGAGGGDIPCEWFRRYEFGDCTLTVAVFENDGVTAIPGIVAYQDEWILDLDGAGFYFRVRVAATGDDGSGFTYGFGGTIVWAIDVPGDRPCCDVSGVTMTESVTDPPGADPRLLVSSATSTLDNCPGAP